jgi:RNA polymerase sigma-70 factor (ECF subfamily)
VEDAPAESDEQFLTIWRAELMARTWDALARLERETGQHLYTVLRFRTDHPDVRSPEMAQRLAAVVGKAVTADWVRRRLHLARGKFTELLLDEVSQSLEGAGPEALDQELIDLGLHAYCRPALERRRSGSDRRT